MQKRKAFFLLLQKVKNFQKSDKKMAILKIVIFSVFNYKM